MSYMLHTPSFVGPFETARKGHTVTVASAQWKRWIHGESGLRQGLRELAGQVPGSF